ncbi:MAG: hypothetical protein AMXMBFR53_43030 [Gemmatimonadota bacterium]
MQTSFTISRSRCSDLADPKLRAEIDGHTGNDDETASILRCVERFGFDVSIRYFEVTPKPSRRTYHGANLVTWSVAAVRS